MPGVPGMPGVPDLPGLSDAPDPSFNGILLDAFNDFIVKNPPREGIAPPEQSQGLKLSCVILM